MARRASNGRSSIYFGSDGRWHGRVSMGSEPSSGKPIRRQVTGKTQAEVTRKVRELEKARELGNTGGSRQTVSAYLSNWIANREALGVRPNTVLGYRVDARHIEAAFGGVQLNKLTVDHVETLWKQMSMLRPDGRTRKGSIPHVRRTLSAVLSDAVKRGLIPRNPVALARTPRHTKPRIEPYTLDEVRPLLDAAQTTRQPARWLIAAILGLRQGEVLGLRWEDLDQQASTLTVARQLQRRLWQHGCGSEPCGSKRGADCPNRSGGGLTTSEPKSDAGHRTIALAPTLLNALLVHRKRQAAERLASAYWDDARWMFPDEWGRPCDPGRDYNAWRALCVTAGVPVRRLHDLRHTAATLLLEAEVDLKSAGQILGHSAVSQTAAYTHVLADRKAAAARAVEAHVFGRTEVS
jgi:integrase